MTIGAVLEPLVIVSLLAGGTLVNCDNTRTSSPSTASSRRPDPWQDIEYALGADGAPREEHHLNDAKWNRSRSSTASTSTIWHDVDDGKLVPAPAGWRQRTLRFWKWKTEVTTPDTEVHKDRFLSRVLRQYPFLVEVWYWALIYWVYQLGRAFTAVTLQASTVDTAREHALKVVHLEQSLGIFIETDIQQWFLGHPVLMRWTNRAYSFIHIPGTILFLIVLFYTTTTRPKRNLVEQSHGGSASLKNWKTMIGPFGPNIYERRRRTMAMCNLLAFIVFTFWPCMPPRLLSADNYTGEHAAEAKSFGFVDTVHGVDGDSSVWTTNRFCNQYAAMPSLHFGYSFFIGLTIATVPLRKSGWMGWRRIAIVCTGMLYPGVILTAIVATANHFILDAVAGAAACLLAWNLNGALLNLLPLEDYFLNALRIYKP
ncbi:PAP2 superfamily-domain-containing protein [Cercophora newfieldiana]|uniref:PAP2 superfamily-domain-containing protein n=1 Tax=Cercophora newfieldiana TaxID=92897 RepID=A0AA39YQS3_9PEZI|nr:PAP2 superfamily-domain-containing protein [Cercophora newfieldiana]